MTDPEDYSKISFLPKNSLLKAVSRVKFKTFAEALQKARSIAQTEGVPINKQFLGRSIVRLIELHINEFLFVSDANRHKNQAKFFITVKVLSASKSFNHRV